MKTILSFILSVLLLISAGAQTTDYVTTKDFQNEKKKLNEGIGTAKKTALEAKQTLLKHDQAIESLNKVIGLYQTQLAVSNDSISRLTIKINELQDTIYQRKTSLRTNLIIAFGLIILLCVLLVIWIFMLKKRSDQYFLALKEEMENAIKKIDEETKNNKELIRSSSDEMNRQLQSGLDQFGVKAGQIERQARETDGRINAYREETEVLMKKQEEKSNALQSLIENKNQELMALINSLEKDQKEIEPGFLEKVNALKTQLEQKIQSISAEIGKQKK